MATLEDEIRYSERKLSGSVDVPEDYYCFAYESSQGYFELVIPKSICEVIETDSTVECLAQYLLQEQKKKSDQNKNDDNEQFWINDIDKEWSGALPATLIYAKNKFLSDLIMQKVQ